MSSFFTHEQLNALNQSIRSKKIRIEVLNYNFKIIDTIEGEALDGSIDINATSDYRRSCNLTMIVGSDYIGLVEKKYLIDVNSLIWLDKYIKIYVGIDDVYTGETVWYNCGIYIIDEPSYSYSATESMLKFSGLDLMFNFSDKRRGQLTDYKTKLIVYDEQTGLLINRLTTRECFMGVLSTYTNVAKYYLAPMTGDFEFIPENIVFESGITIYDMLSKLLSYLPGWEMFFDVDGVFIVQPIPDGITDAIYPLEEEYTSMEEVSVDFSNVKNLIVVRGRTHDCDYFVNADNGDVVNYNGQILEITMSSNVELSNNITLGFVCPDNEYNPLLNRLSLNGEDFYLYDFEKQNNGVLAETFQPGSIIVLRFVQKDNLDFQHNTENYWDFLSNDQANSFAVNDIIESPYYINAELKEENYYGGLTYCANHINYVITLNNERTLTELNDKVLITLMPNIYNKQNLTLTVKDNISGNSLVQNLPIVKDSLPNIVTLDEAQWTDDNTIYVLQYNKTNSCFVLKGRLQSFTYYLSGGEYENIYSNSLAKERAEYELYLHSNLNDQISINTVPNYCLDVNKRVSYQTFLNDEPEYYLTKTISLPLVATGATMNIGAMQIYPEKFYISTQTIGCILTIVDQNGNYYSNGDIVKQGSQITIYANAEEHYTDNFTITINGTVYNIGSVYKVVGNVNIVAEAQPEV